MTQRRHQLSRRQFGALAAAAAAPFLMSRRSAGAAGLTAQDLVDRIKAQLGGEWRPDSVDGLKVGDPSTVVTGIATTSMATLAVLQQAVKAGANVVISAQPTFYAKSDARNPPVGRVGGAARGAAGAGPAAAVTPSTPADPIFAGKNDFIAKNNLVVIRLGEHWKSRQPDPLAQGIGAALGWTRYQAAGDPQRYDVPALSLEALVSTVKKGLNSRGGIRVVGDPQTTVRHVGLLPGTTPIQAALKLLPTVDAILAGEVREWESVEYARDKAFAGERKGLILVGRVVSEEPGMNVCATWLKTFVTEVPVRHMPAGDPYWRPVA